MSEQPVLESAMAVEIIALLEAGATDPAALDVALAALEARWGGRVYTVLLFVLTHLDFPDDNGRAQWDGVRDHWNELRARLGKPVDLRVAVLDHFLSSPRRLRNPAIVEIRILRRTRRSVMVDELTRLYNYRYFQERVSSEARRAERYGSTLALLMADVDDFKSYNDAHGHLAGNVALRRLATVLRRSVREVDVVARYGGEEFAILLPATARAAALRVAEKLRQSVQTAAIGARARPAASPVTVSIGVATLPGDASTAQELVARADRALYAAKSQGKNRVVPFSDERREHPRLEAALQGRFSAFATDTHPLTTRNVSEGGLLFVSPEAIAPGTVARVQLSLPPAGEPCDCVLRVARATRCADGWHVSGPILHMPKPHARRFRMFLQQLRESSRRPATSGRTRGRAAS